MFCYQFSKMNKQTNHLITETLTSIRNSYHFEFSTHSSEIGMKLVHQFSLSQTHSAHIAYFFLHCTNETLSNNSNI